MFQRIFVRFKLFLRRWWMRAIFACLFPVALFSFDLFGLRTLSDSYSRNLFVPISAPFYPSEGQRHVTAVIIDDHTAEAIAERYPIGLADHGRFVSRMLCEGPSVIIVAVSFRYLRDGIEGVEAFKNLLRFRLIDGECRQVSANEALLGMARNAKGQVQHVTKVFLAASSQFAGRCVPFSNALADNCNEAKEIDSLKSAAEPVDFTSTTLDNGYKLWRDGTATPALRAFIAFCERSGRQLATCAKPLTPSEADLVTYWGLYPSPMQAELAEASGRGRSAKNCFGSAGPATGWLGKLAESKRVLERIVAINTFGAKDEERIETRTSCRYATEISADLLIERPKGDPLLAAAIQNRVVVYGTEIAGLRDDEIVPIYGRVPGAHFNAMVIDNLISYGAEYKREPSQIPFVKFNFTWLNLIELLWTVAMIGLARGLIGYFPPTQRRFACWPSHHVQRAIVFYTLATFAMFAIYAVAVWMLHWSAPNIIGMLATKAADAGLRKDD